MRIIASPSIHERLPASTDSTVARPPSWIRSSRHRRPGRRSACPGSAWPLSRCEHRARRAGAARAITASVPSIASTATTAAALTARSGRCRARRSRRRCCSRTRDRLLVGVRGAGGDTPSRASNVPERPVESSSVMPWSRGRPRPPRLIASVFRDLSLVIRAQRGQVGRMSENSLVCFTWPAITASLTPAAFRRLMHCRLAVEIH